MAFRDPEAGRIYRREWGRNRYATDPEYRRRRNEQAGAWQKAHPDSMRGKYLRYNYGLSADEYDAMLAVQGGVCALCQKPETRQMAGRVLRLSVDHDAQTGRIRGLLCASCNTGIGALLHDPAILGRAIAYLTKEG